MKEHFSRLQRFLPIAIRYKMGCQWVSNYINQLELLLFSKIKKWRGETILQVKWSRPLTISFILVKNYNIANLFPILSL